jgi:hypothetical protein
VSSPDELRVLKIDVRDKARDAVVSLRKAASGVSVSDAPEDMIRPIRRLTKSEREELLMKVRRDLDEIVRLCS